VKEIASMIKENFPNYSVKSKELPFIFIKIYSFFDDTVKFIMPFWDRELAFDNTLSMTVLGVSYRNILDTIIDAV
jgi:hypothetical protein